MALITPPEAGQDSRELWKVVAEAVSAINALADAKINVSQDVNKLTLTTANATFDLMLGGTGTATVANSVFLADFSLYDATAKHTSAGGLWVGIKYGNLTPNGGNLASGVNPWPNQFSDVTSPPNTYEFAVSASGIAWVQVVVNPAASDDGSQPFSVSSISIGHGTSLPENTETEGHFTLGGWSVTSPGGVQNLTINNGSGLGSLSYGYCGGSHYFDGFFGGGGQT